MGSAMPDCIQTASGFTSRISMACFRLHLAVCIEVVEFTQTEPTSD